MEFTELADYPVTPGTVTEWHPAAQDAAGCPGTDTADPWFDDRRPTSFVQESRLRDANARSDVAHQSWLGAAFEIAGRLDAEAFGRAVRGWIDRHEGLRSHAAVPAGEGALLRRTLTPGRVRVTARRHGYRTSGAENFEHLRALFDDCTSPTSWPAFVFATVEPPDRERGFTVYFAADHAVVDGYSVVLVAQEIAALYRGEGDGTPPDLLPVGSYLDFGALERAAAADLDATHPAVDLWRAVLDDGDGHLPEFPLDLGDLPEVPLAQRGLSAWVLDADAAEAFAVTCRKIGHGVFAGTLACLALTGADLADTDRFRAVTPMHTRHGAGWAGSVGWFVGIGPISFEVGGATSFAEVLRRASSGVEAAKPAALVPFERIGEVLGTTARPRFVVSFMDVRFVPAAARWPEWNARALRSEHCANDVYIWVNRTPQGVNIAARYPATDDATAAVHRYLARLRHLMSEVAGAGTFTPSAAVTTPNRETTGQ